MSNDKTITIPLRLAADVLGSLFYAGTFTPQGFEQLKQEFAALMRSVPIGNGTCLPTYRPSPSVLLLDAAAECSTPMQYDAMCTLIEEDADYARRLLNCINKRQGQATDEVNRYARELATALWKKHYSADAPQWQLMHDPYGVLSQIDNMTTGLVRATPAQPIADVSAPADEVAREQAVLLAGIQALCISADQELSSQDGSLSDFDKGWFMGQLHVFDLYTPVEKEAVIMAREFIEAHPARAAAPYDPIREGLPQLPKGKMLSGMDMESLHVLYTAGQMQDYARFALAARAAPCAPTDAALVALLDGYARDGTLGHQHYYDRIVAWADSRAAAPVSGPSDA